MMNRSFSLAVSVSIIALSAFNAAHAQTASMSASGILEDETIRAKSETAELYATTMETLASAIERAIAADPGISVITELRAGSIETLSTITDEQRALIDNLGIRARVIDVNTIPGEPVDERIVVYLADATLKQSVTRAEIEEEALRNGNIQVSRIQDGRVTNTAGAFDIPQEYADLFPSAGVGIYLGIRGNDYITSDGNDSLQVRVLACDPGEYGSGIVEQRDLARETNLGGDLNEVAAPWVEVSRSCFPEFTQTVRFFDTCTASDGSTGQALYEGTQFVRQNPSDPFAVEIFLDRTGAVQVNESECITGDRLNSSQDFFVDGHTQAPRELQLRTSTSASDIGSGTNTVPEAVNGGGAPVSGIPFIATSTADFAFERTCVQEYGTVPVPSPFSGPDIYTGDVFFNRDYNRRETYFSDNPNEYILNYDLVLDPNPYGYAPRGRGFVDATFGPAPAGDGWYKRTETCERTLTRPEQETATRSCSTGYPSHPNGTYQERRDGIGTYIDYTADNPVATGQVLQFIDWDPWYEISNGCYYTTVTRTNQTRTIGVTVGGEDCSQRQRRTRVVTTRHFYTGGTSSSTTYDPNWTDVGGPFGCSAPPGGGGTPPGGGGTPPPPDPTPPPPDPTPPPPDPTPAPPDPTPAPPDPTPAPPDPTPPPPDPTPPPPDPAPPLQDPLNPFGNDRGEGGDRSWDSDGDGITDRSSPPPGPAGSAGPGVAGPPGSRDDSGGGSGNGNSGNCFAAGTMIEMADGTTKAIEDIRTGDNLSLGGCVLATGRFIADDLYKLGEVLVTGTHLVQHNGVWMKVSDHPMAVRMLRTPVKVYNLATVGNVILSKGTLFADHSEIAGALPDYFTSETFADMSHIACENRKVA